MKKTVKTVRTVVEALKAAGIHQYDVESVRNFLKNKRIRIHSNTDSHNYPIGDEYVLSGMEHYESGQMNGIPRKDGYPGNTIRYSSIILLDNTLNCIKEELASAKKRVNTEIAFTKILEEKIAFMEESKVDTFEEKDYIAFKLNKLFDSSIDTKTKVAEAMALLA